ncbi:phage/plasmid primase, P4 family [Sedimentitalea sp.]|uniref:phage/plasmid primase, P4 family n=1 Tax=Sedimentitalea sp. TaxID=2048915 RepID=UPI003297AF5F
MRSEGGDLPRDFILHLGKEQTVTVGEVMDNPQVWGKRACCSPLEPDYRNYAKTATILAGEEIIIDHAHGDKVRFKLGSAQERIGDAIASGLMPETPTIPEGLTGEIVARVEKSEIEEWFRDAVELDLYDTRRMVVDPRRLEFNSRLFVERYFTVDGKRTLITWQGQTYRWMVTHWEPVEERFLSDILLQWFSKFTCFEKTIKLDGESKTIRDIISPTIPFQKNYVSAIQAVTTRPRHLIFGWSENRPGTWQSVQNGILDLDTARLLDHTPDYFNVSWVAAPWTPDVEIAGTRMFRFLWETFGTEDQLLLVQEIIGYLLSGETRFQKAFMLFGLKRSGKGTLLRLLRSLLAGSLASARSSELSDKFVMERTIGKLGLLIPDIRLSKDSAYEVITELLLTVSGEDHVDIRRMNQPAWQGETTVRIFAVSNSVPQFRDQDGVVADRFMYMRCPNSFAGREDVNLLEDLLAELDVLLFWAVKGWQRLRMGGRFTESEEHKRIVRDVRTKMDPVGEFIGQNTTITGDSNHFVSIDDLFSHFELFCGNHGVGGWSKDGFSKKLGNKSFSISRATRNSGMTRGFSGLYLGSSDTSDTFSPTPFI